MNWIGPQGAAALANTLRGLPLLAHIFKSYCPSIFTLQRPLHADFLECQKGHLALSENELRSEGAVRLSEVLQTCHHLTSLDVSHNGRLFAEVLH
jgi:hypothetical protein